MNITEKEFEVLGARLVNWQVLYTKTIDGYKLFLPKFDVRINWIKNFLKEVLK